MTMRSIAFVALALMLSLLAGCGDDAEPTQNNAAAGTVYERPYSVSMGPQNAKVTIVEFFDPACEACRAFYPFVKEIMARHPEDVRLVLRYASFHQGSETVIRMLEAAREQNKFNAVLEAVLAKQEEWADHHQPNVAKAWTLAEAAGLDLERAKSVMDKAEISRRLAQENKDIRTLKVSQTPTFYVNEKALPSFGPQQLYALVVSEIEAQRAP